MRIAGGLLLAITAAGCALLAFGALKNLWASYQDSPTSTYLLIGSAWLALTICLLVAAIRVLRRR
jgi:hypothetical protein